LIERYASFLVRESLVDHILGHGANTECRSVPFSGGVFHEGCAVCAKFFGEFDPKGLDGKREDFILIQGDYACGIGRVEECDYLTKPDTAPKIESVSSVVMSSSQPLE